MTRAQFLRVALGVFAAPLATVGLLSAQQTGEADAGPTWKPVSLTSFGHSVGPHVARPGCGDNTDTPCQNNDGDDDDGGDGSGGGVGWGDGGTGGPGGNPGHNHHCNPHFPSPENDTIVLGLIGGGAAFWPQLKAKIHQFLQ